MRAFHKTHTAIAARYTLIVEKAFFLSIKSCKNDKFTPTGLVSLLVTPVFKYLPSIVINRPSGGGSSALNSGNYTLRKPHCV